MTTTPPSGRPARATDIVTIVDYHHRCWLQSFRPIVDDEVMNFVEQRDRADVEAVWHSRLNTPGSTVWVATDAADRAIGHVWTHDHELVHLFIDPNHHGQGLGRHLLAVGEQQIADAGYTEAELHTMVDNTPAIELYRSAGWVVTDETLTEELPNGSSYVEHVLRRQLDAG